MTNAGAVRIWDCNGIGVIGAGEITAHLEESPDTKPHMGIQPAVMPEKVEGGVLGDFLGMEDEDLSAEPVPGPSLLHDAEGRMLREMETGDQVFGLKFWPNHPHMLAAGADDRVMLWDVARGLATAGGTIQKHDGSGEAFGGPRNEENKTYVFGLEFSPDGGLLAACGSDGDLHMIDPRCLAIAGVLQRGLEEGATPRGPQAPLASAQFSPAGDAVVASATDGSCCVWDLRAGRLRILVSQAHAGPCYQAKWANGEVLLTTGHDGLVKLWDALHGTTIASAKYSSQLLCCAVSRRISQRAPLIAVAGGGQNYIGLMDTAQTPGKL